MGIVNEVKMDIESEIAKRVRNNPEGWEEPPDRDFSPPKSLEVFEYRLLICYRDTQTSHFGHAHFLAEGKTLKKRTDYKALVDTLIVHEKCSKRVKRSRLNPKDVYEFLKYLLERNAPTGLPDEFILGFQRDRSRRLSKTRLELSIPEKNKIAAQAAAQVLWFIEGERIPTLAEMGKRLRQAPFTSLFGFHKLHKVPNFLSWIRPVFPVPSELRKQNQIPSHHFKTVAEIPDIFTEKGVDFLRLLFALQCITRVMKSQGMNLNQIRESQPVSLLIGNFRFYLQDYAEDWIKMYYESNSHILA